MSFNPDRSKQELEVIFLRKTSIIIYASLTFHSNHVRIATSQKHLGMILESKLNFKKRISQKIDKVT